MSSIFDQDLPQTPANYAAMSPLSFIERSAQVYPQRLAVVHGSGPQALRRSWSELYSRCRRLASALQRSGIRKGDTVAVMLPNTPPMVEAHFGIPMAGAILNTLNTRLDASTVAFMLNHGEARAVIVDGEFSHTMQQALEILERENGRKPVVIDALDELAGVDLPRIGSLTYEELLEEGDPGFEICLPEDEWQSICLNYTSGTTGDPKGVVYSHRGAAINAISNILEWDMPHHPVYLWTLPMFHCNGWCFPWTIAAAAGTSVCLRKVEAKKVMDLIADEGVTHFSGAPIVLNGLVNLPDDQKRDFSHPVKVTTAGAAPPASVIAGVEKLGIDVTHVYGLTEVYGPVTVCAWREAWK